MEQESPNRRTSGRNHKEPPSPTAYKKKQGDLVGCSIDMMQRMQSRARARAGASCCA